MGPGKVEQLCLQLLKRLGVVNAAGVFTAVAPVTVDWTSYTPSYNWTTNTSITGEYRVVDGGETLEIRVRINITGAPTMLSNLAVGLPGGYTAKSNGVNGYMIGLCNCFDSDAGSGVQNWVATMCFINGSNELVLFAPSASVIGGVSGSGITTTAPFTFANGDSISMYWRIPLA